MKSIERARMVLLEATGDATVGFPDTDLTIDRLVAAIVQPGSVQLSKAASDSADGLVAPCPAVACGAK